MVAYSKPVPSPQLSPSVSWQQRQDLPDAAAFGIGLSAEEPNGDRQAFCPEDTEDQDLRLPKLSFGEHFKLATHPELSSYTYG